MLASLGQVRPCNSGLQARFALGTARLPSLDCLRMPGEDRGRMQTDIAFLWIDKDKPDQVALNLLSQFPIKVPGRAVVQPSFCNGLISDGVEVAGEGECGR